MGTNSENVEALRMLSLIEEHRRNLPWYAWRRKRVYQREIERIRATL